MLLSAPLAELVFLPTFDTFCRGCLGQSYCPVAEAAFWFFFPPTLQRPVKAEAKLSRVCKGLGDGNEVESGQRRCSRGARVRSRRLRGVCF